MEKGKSAAPSVQIGTLFQGSVKKVFITQGQNSHQAKDSNDSNEVGDDDDCDDDNENYDDHDKGDGEDNCEDLDPKDKEPAEERDPVLLYPSFQATYRAMRTGCKWKLSTGRYVEDIVFEACTAMDSKLFADCIAQLFVLDLEDTTVRGWFGDKELEEIDSRVLPLPPRDEMLMESTRRFWHVGVLVHERGVTLPDFRR